MLSVVATKFVMWLRFNAYLVVAMGGQEVVLADCVLMRTIVPPDKVVYWGSAAFVFRIAIVEVMKLVILLPSSANKRS